MLDGKEKVPDGTDPKLENKDQQQNNDKPKLYEESVVKEIIAERDKAKERLRKIETDQTKLEEERRSKELKDKNDYETLMAESKLKTEKQHQLLKNKVAEMELHKLGVEHKLAKPEYLSIFKSTVDVDDEFQVKNLDSVKKDFEQFKKDNPNLFLAEDKKLVPKTDSKPFKKPDSNQFEGISREQMLEAAGQKISEEYFQRHKK